MRFLVVGLGSMGKKRLRCLALLGHEAVGYDVREDRRREAEARYRVRTVARLEDLDLDEFDAYIVSTPPHLHNPYIELALEHRKPVFVEASFRLEGLEELNRRAKELKVLVAPSRTMIFHPAIREIRRIVKSGEYGRPTNFTYHCGQYLLDWHPYESPREFYAGKRETGGGPREIVPFELFWITDILGMPKRIKGYYGKTMELGVDVDDTYAFTLEFDRLYGALVIDTVARYPTRSLILNLERAQILWRIDEDIVKLYDADLKRWIHYHMPQEKTVPEDGFHVMYVEELKAFIDAVEGRGEFPNTLDRDIEVIRLLYQLEEEAHR
jgi:predicted dehydrogenase